MKRKDFLKNVSVIGAVTLLPKITFPQIPLSQNKFHFIGLGGGGTNALLAFYNNGVKGNFTSIDTEHIIPATANINHIDCSKNPFNPNHWLFNKSLSPTKKFKKIYHGNEHFVILTGIGGQTGSTLLISILEVMQLASKNITVLATLPFNFEGINKAAYSKATTSTMASYKNFYAYPADNLRTKYPDLKMKNSFNTLNNELYQLWINECSHIH